MKHIAILGGGIAGLAAAYELEQARQRDPEIDWHLYEASPRLGGTVQTTRQDGFILEGGPDAWVTEKPWARDLAIELGLKADLISSNDATRKTYIYLAGELQPMPAAMRLMVPTDLSTLEQSPLFSPAARAAYAAEPTRAAELKAAAPTEDESVATFVLRHFGPEVLDTIAAPLLAGVFGGDVHKLSVQAVMPAFVSMEREHGSLILALQQHQRDRGNKPPQPVFTTLRNGMASLTDALIARLPAERLHLNRPVLSLKREGKRWLVRSAAFNTAGRTSKKHFHYVLLATPADTTRTLLAPLDPRAAALLPTDASSAVLVNLCWPADTAATFTLPQGFGFLVPQHTQDGRLSAGAQRNEDIPALRTAAEPQLLAATFTDQKFPHRAPPGARILRAFFGTGSAEHFANSPDPDIIAAALTQLTSILGALPQPTLTTVHRWPRSLPQYEAGHPARVAELDRHIATLGNLSLLGNAYRGVGLPDLIRDARAAVRALAPANALTRQPANAQE